MLTKELKACLGTFLLIIFSQQFLPVSVASATELIKPLVARNLVGGVDVKQVFMVCFACCECLHAVGDSMNAAVTALLLRKICNNSVM